MSHRGSRFKYQLPLLRDYFHACHALIRARDLSITAIQLHIVTLFRRRRGPSCWLLESDLVSFTPALPETVRDRGSGQVVPSSGRWRDPKRRGELVRGCGTARKTVCQRLCDGQGFSEAARGSLRLTS